MGRGVGPEGIGYEGAAGSAGRTGAGKPDSRDGEKNGLKNKYKGKNDVGEVEYRQRNIACAERHRETFQHRATGVFMLRKIVRLKVIVRVFVRDDFAVMVLYLGTHRVIGGTHHQSEQPAGQDDPRNIAQTNADDSTLGRMAFLVRGQSGARHQ